MFLGTPRGYKGVDDLAAAVARLGRPRRDAGPGRGRPRWRGGAAAALDVRRGSAWSAASRSTRCRSTSRRQTWSWCPSATRPTRAVRCRPSSSTRMALGRPLVSTRVSMIPEVIEGCGLLAPAGDVPALAHVIGRLLDHPDEAARARPARARARRRALQLRGRARAALPAGRTGHGWVARMKLAIICRPFSFHGGVETATAGLLGELDPARPPDRSREHPGSARCAGGHGAATPRTGPALRAPASLLRARRAPRRPARAATTSCRATSAVSARTSTARARGPIAAISRRWVGCTGGAPTTALVLALRAADLHASDGAARRGHLAPGRRGDRRGATARRRIA